MDMGGWNESDPLYNLDNSSYGTGIPNGTWIRDPPSWSLIALSIIPFWILSGNLLVLMAVIRNRQLRTLSNWVIASLAVTDFLLAIFVVPLGVYQTVAGRWELGLVVCLIWTGSDVFLSTTSILHLCAIAIHRYHGIKNPLRVRSVLDNKYVATLLIPTWSISFAISLPLVVQGAMDTHHVLIGDSVIGYSCGIFHRTFAIYSSLVSFFIPLAIMLFADTRSIQILRRHVKFPLRTDDKLEPSTPKGPHHRNGRAPGKGRYSPAATRDTAIYEVESNEATTTTVLTPMVEYRPCSKSDGREQDLVFISPQISPDVTPKRKKRTARAPSNQPFKGRNRSKSMVYISMLASRGAVKINSRERRAERTLIWVFVCFVVLWLPFFITNLTYGLCNSCDIPPEVFLTFTWLGYLSSGVNPCIYTFLNKDFRNAFIKILTCHTRRGVPRKSTCS